ncbi:MAG: hypothetical protein J3K34DRAFT_443503 [Monoraphidium minutum]|nr:MAG: hypothetical protein J3K34DRAFT_443503 [Monoraphidium minutum]
MARLAGASLCILLLGLVAVAQAERSLKVGGCGPSGSMARWELSLAVGGMGMLWTGLAQLTRPSARLGRPTGLLHLLWQPR